MYTTLNSWRSVASIRFRKDCSYETSLSLAIRSGGYLGTHPAGIVACQILDKKSYADIPRSGHAATFTVPRGQLKYLMRRQITQNSRFQVIFN